ncbi:Sensor histidine kinase YycG [Poriferisphaera corsica]|uniref:histidine kinase n=1 Tax=Poriferisphaera corsica TaxID=2528020 RepID=A0A517YYB0_9BACT|nr:ATP-binding protein [Poriferisphaera corsica]QDU35198.1 Sensor histidine kinase YycG [Poriferisphaera corsica]
MSACKYINIAAVASSSMLVMVLVAVVLNVQGINWLGMIAIATGGGAACVVMMIWQCIIMHQSQAEVIDAVTHIELLLEGKAEEGRFKSRFGYDGMMKVVADAVEQVRGKQSQLLIQKRELDIRLRLAEAEQKHLVSILDSLNDAVVVTDSFNELAMANTAASRLFHFDIDESKRMPVDEVIADPSISRLITDIRESRQRGMKRVEQRIMKAGEESIYDVTLSCVDAEMQPSNVVGGIEEQVNAGVVTILRDVTKEREIAETKSDFVSNVSHELRTPLSSIKAYMEMLIDGEAADDETRHEFYNIVQSETNRLSRLIDNILNISRIESGMVRIQREHVEISSLVGDAISIMLPQARAKRIELVQNSVITGVQVFADHDMILQSVLNLISNAIKYTEHGGRVVVSLRVGVEGEKVTVSVTDNGVGIPEISLPHLFDKFYRVADHKNLAKGTGLGLNLVKHVIETVHGGRINVESTVNHGSTFTFALPIADNT